MGMTRATSSTALLAIMSLAASLPAACGSSNTGSGIASDGDSGAGDGPAADAAVPTIADSCTALCAKKAALACAKDPLPGECQPRCETSQDHATCPRESAVLAACVAAGNVICSVDQESTPVAPCGPETRSLSTCLAASPAGDAGGD
jgi:hypothetical protein